MVATPIAVANLTAQLLNITTPEGGAEAHSKPLQYRPDQLIIKFRDLDGGNYSQIVDTVNRMAGIDIIKALAPLQTSIRNMLLAALQFSA